MEQINKIVFFNQINYKQGKLTKFIVWTESMSTMWYFFEKFVTLNGCPPIPKCQESSWGYWVEVIIKTNKFEKTLKKIENKFQDDSNCHISMDFSSHKTQQKYKKSKEYELDGIYFLELI